MHGAVSPAIVSDVRRQNSAMCIRRWPGTPTSLESSLLRDARRKAWYVSIGFCIRSATAEYSQEIAWCALSCRRRIRRTMGSRCPATGGCQASACANAKAARVEVSGTSRNRRLLALMRDRRPHSAAELLTIRSERSRTSPGHSPKTGRRRLQQDGRPLDLGRRPGGG